jgi:hypothetical protein
MKHFYGLKMINQTLAKDMNSIRRLGIEALNEKLGPLGMVIIPGNGIIGWMN